jgi:RimJ/RimL family protein N-acetyltransferase
MKFKIKRIKTNKEWQTLLKLNSVLFKGCEPYIRHQLGAYWLVYHKTKAIGFFGVNEIEDLKGVAFFSRSGFLEQYTRRGLHKRSLRCRKQYCKKLGIKRLVTYTHKYNLRSANNLEAFGFRIYTPIETKGVIKDMYYFHLFIND